MTQPKTQNEEKQEVFDPFAIIKTESNQDKQELGLLDLLSRVKKHISAVPTFTPRNFYEQIQFFYDGTDYKLYLHIDGVWKSITLT